MLHRLDEMVFVGICALVSGAEGWSGIVEFAQTKQTWLKQFARLDNGIPVDDTFARVLSVPAPKALTEYLPAWTQALAAHLSPGELIAIDAMSCQTAIAEQIVRQGVDYLLAVKDNQASLDEAVCDFFSTARGHQFAGLAHSFAETVDAGHGRIETRRCWAGECLQTLANPGRWFGLKSIVMIERDRLLGETVTVEQAYFISSAPAQADRLGNAARAHGSVENSCHWMIDVTFNEDQCRIRRGDGAHNFALLRQFALNLLKQEPSKASIRKKRFRLASAMTSAFKSLPGLVKSCVCPECTPLPTL